MRHNHSNGDPQLDRSEFERVEEGRHPPKIWSTPSIAEFAPLASNAGALTRRFQDYRELYQENQCDQQWKIWDWEDQSVTEFILCRLYWVKIKFVGIE